MAVKMRLRREGKRKQPFYRIVVADVRSPRDGRYIEDLGYYHPIREPSEISINSERALHWLRNGVQPSQAVQNLLRITGVWEEFRPGEADPHAERRQRRAAKRDKKVASQEASRREEMAAQREAQEAKAAADAAEAARLTAQAAEEIEQPTPELTEAADAARDRVAEEAPAAEAEDDSAAETQGEEEAK